MKVSSTIKLEAVAGAVLNLDKFAHFWIEKPCSALNETSYGHYLISGRKTDGARVNLSGSRGV